MRFPFSVGWHAERGAHYIRRGAGEGHLEAGAIARIKAEELFDICLVPDHTGAVAGTIELEVDTLASGPEPDWVSLATAFLECSPSFGLALTQEMFRLPWYGWGPETVATKLETTRRCVQQKLFREAYSFYAALRRCRRLHSLLNRDAQKIRAIDGQQSNPIHHLPRSWNSRPTQSSKLVM
ncbi:hypothetical protein AWB82_03260 [Caballeronia glebae]|uniref:Uncharacterized protein n=2 Tax=Caballeronia glebae TaxID=1777143 RepID=A0A158AYV4_9BURK|nr:hypothetical protein AWB82_03260 [Caballeronia glebae]